MAITTFDFIIASELAAAIGAVFPEHAGIVPAGMKGSPMVASVYGPTYVLANAALSPAVAMHGADTFDVLNDVIDASGVVAGIPLYTQADGAIFTSPTTAADLLAQFAARLAFLRSFGQDFRQLGYFYRFFTPSNTWQGVACVILVA